MAAGPTRFDRDTAVRRVGEDAWEGRIDPAWSVLRGPNGGYVAAIVLRALTEAVDDPARAPRSLTVHYVRPAGDGPVTVSVVLERRGRSLTSCTARLAQDDRLVATAMAAFSAARPGPEFCDLTPPTAPPPAEVPVSRPPDDAPEIARRWETRWAVGAPPQPGAPPAGAAVAGGWIRLEEPHLLDACMVAAVTDAWLPPVFARVGQPFAVPTVDLTVHFRTSLPRPGATPDDFALATFRTSAATEGFLEEDGEVWSADGVLLAQSRQLAAILPFG